MIEDIIRQKPHLADPFRFYSRFLSFIDSVNAIPISVKRGDPAYPPESVDAVFHYFSGLFQLPEGTLFPLQEAMRLREIDFTRLPKGEVPSFSLPYAEDDLSMLLFLLSKPYFQRLRAGHSADGRIWESGKCPVCAAQPAVSWINEEGTRQLFCSFCGTSGPASAGGCPLCLSQHNEKQKTLRFQGEEGFTVDACDQCNSYVKTIDRDMLSRFPAEIADLMSLPLDIVVQEKGYARRAPNPIGIRKITTKG
jgi:FdhE protein